MDLKICWFNRHRSVFLFVINLIELSLASRDAVVRLHAPISRTHALKSVSIIGSIDRLLDRSIVIDRLADPSIDRR